MSERAGTVSEPSRCDCRWSEDCPEVPCGCGLEQVRLYRDEAYHWRGLHWRSPCLIAALAAPRPSADPVLPPELREQTDQGDGLLGNTGIGNPTGPPSTSRRPSMLPQSFFPSCGCTLDSRNGDRVYICPEHIRALR
jgi:hypothetical protein